MSDSSDKDILAELAELPTVAHPSVSPDGTDIALYHDIGGRNELYVVDPNTAELTQWSDGEVPRDATHGIDWDADGDRVFFHLDDDGNEQNDIYAIDRSGSVEPIVEMDGQILLHDVGENGEMLVLGSNRDGQMNVYGHDLRSGETTKLTDYDRAVWMAHLSPDGDQIAYATNESDDYDNRDVYVANADGSTPRNLEIGHTGAEASPVDWHPNGDKLLVNDNTPDLGRCGVYDFATDEVTWFGNQEYEETGSFFLPDGKRFIASRVHEAEHIQVVYNVETEQAHEFELSEGFTTTPTDRVLSDGRVLVGHETPTHRRELLAYDTETDEYETVLEAEYGPFSPDDFMEAAYFTFNSDGIPETTAHAVEHNPYDGLEIGGLLYDSGQRPSPLIVNPHGGPRFQNYKEFSYRIQYLLMHGFSVLQVNYRGSTGRGREFAEELYDDWGGAEQGDIASGVEYVLQEHDWLNEEQVIVYGGSYGGYSANWQMVQYPELYAAGITWVGLSDLTDMYENTMPHFRSELMEKNLGEPTENPTIYEERSPVTHASNLSAPLLIGHGVNDPRVPVSQARLLRDALDDAGFEDGDDYEYEELGEEGHGSTDIDQKRRELRLLDDFLDRRIETEQTDEAAVND